MKYVALCARNNITKGTIAIRTKFATLRQHPSALK